jgi:hypothetical protein
MAKSKVLVKWEVLLKVLANQPPEDLTPAGRAALEMAAEIRALAPAADVAADVQEIVLAESARLLREVALLVGASLERDPGEVVGRVRDLTRLGVLVEGLPRGGLLRRRADDEWEYRRGRVAALRDGSWTGTTALQLLEEVFARRRKE